MLLQPTEWLWYSIFLGLPKSFFKGPTVAFKCGWPSFWPHILLETVWFWLNHHHWPGSRSSLAISTCALLSGSVRCLQRLSFSCVSRAQSVENKHTSKQFLWRTDTLPHKRIFRLWHGSYALAYLRSHRWVNCVWSGHDTFLAVFGEKHWKAT